MSRHLLSGPCCLHRRGDQEGADQPLHVALVCNKLPRFPVFIVFVVTVFVFNSPSCAPPLQQTSQVPRTQPLLQTPLSSLRSPARAGESMTFPLSEFGPTLQLPLSPASRVGSRWPVRDLQVKHTRQTRIRFSKLNIFKKGVSGFEANAARTDQAALREQEQALQRVSCFAS